MSIEIAKKLIAEAKAKKLTRLDLGMCGLTDLEKEVPELFELENLEELYLSNRWLEYGERWVNSQNNGIDNLLSILPSAIEKLKNLKVFICSGEGYNDRRWQIADITALANLRNLHTLDLSMTQITDISVLVNLQDLHTLYLADTSIADISVIKSLQKLKKLILCITQITDINALENLRNLYQLSLHSTQITDINPLVNLQNLRLLHLFATQITDINSLVNLQNLQQLDIHSTQITDINSLVNLQNLQRLDIHSTQITDIRPLLHLLKRKEKPLHCVINKELFTETIDGEINLTDCPLTHPPMEIVAQGNEAIIRYFEEIDRAGLTQVREAKLILAGSGESGKTSLRIRLNDKNAPLPKKDERTRNVEVDIYPFPSADGNTFQAHVWDFGGQQIIHHFHRFFMNEDALYVLMTETSRENDNFDYWLQNIQLFGKGSPILFVQNKINGIPRSLNIANYKQHFAIQEDLIEVNLLTNDGLDTLEKAIQYHLQKLPITQRAIPTSWFEIRKSLEKERLQTAILTYEKFVQLCNQQGITERAKIEDVGTFLHTLGIVLWYKENATLHGKMILQREWATEAIFELIFNGNIQKTARFDKKTAQNVWDNCGKNANYAHHCNELVAMMCEFRLCYPQRNKKNAYIIPALLPAKPSEVKWLYEQRIRIVYKYAHIPQGIANYIAAEMHDKIIDDVHVWSEGFYIHTKNAQAKITEYKYTNQLEIIIAGEEHQTLFGEIKGIIEKMHKDYAGIEPTLEIPCICEACEKLPLAKRESYKYVDVIKRKNKGAKLTIECRASEIDVPLKALLDNFLPNKLQEKNYEERNGQIKGLVWDNNMQEALSQLAQYLEGKPEYNDVIMLSARLKRCELEYFNQTINVEQYNLTLNQITKSVLSLLDSYK